VEEITAVNIYRVLIAALIWNWCVPAIGAPHIVVFIADDLGYLDSEVYGAKDVRTPNMLRLAQSGITFTHCFVASPSCAPSRAALLTGLMAARNGAEANHSKPRAELKKLPAYLQEIGYEVAGFGKVAHYNHDRDYGFDHYDKEHAPTVVAKFLAHRDKSKPLCLFVGAHAPHVPWTTNAAYSADSVRLPVTHIDTPATRAFRSRYYTDVTKVDAELGGIYDLARAHLGTNVLFIFTSDHGAQWPFGKWNLYDAGIRVALMAAWPGTIAPGSRTDAMVSWIDILPTLVEVGGGTAAAQIDGRSFAPVLRGEAREHHDRIFSTHSGDGRMNVYPIRSVRTRDWKYILNLHPEFKYTTHIDAAEERDGVKYWREWQAEAATNGRAAQIVNCYHARPREELYDLRRDPLEQHNLSADASQTGRLDGLRQEVRRWMAEQGDKQTVFNEPRFLQTEKAIP
jgi:N-sulfoglucosamine sulfohydrolase